MFKCNSIADTGENPVIPPYEQIQQLSISGSQGWRLTVQSNGSGRLVFGSNPLDVANIPSGSLDVRGFYDAVAPTLQTNSPGTKCFSVTLRRAGDVSVNALYTSNEAAVSKIFAAAKTHAKAVDEARFDALVKDHPIDSKTP